MKILGRRIPRASVMAPSALLLVAACSGSSFTTSGSGTGSGSGKSSSAKPSPFSGTWKCTGSTTYTFTTPSGHAPYTYTDTPTTVVFAIDDGQPITFTSTSSTGESFGDGGGGCSLTYDTSGSMATLKADQSCYVKLTSASGGTLSVDVKFLTGSAAVSGTTLVASSNDSFTGTETTSGGLSIALAGTIATSSSCTP